MMFPLVRELAVDGIPVAVTCRVLGFSKQAYFKWRASPVTDRDWDDAHLINASLDLHGDDPEFGYRLLTRRTPTRRPEREREQDLAVVIAADLRRSHSRARSEPQAWPVGPRRPSGAGLHR
jgi:putative transposase